MTRLVHQVRNEVIPQFLRLGRADGVGNAWVGGAVVVDVVRPSGEVEFGGAALVEFAGFAVDLVVFRFGVADHFDSDGFSDFTLILCHDE